LINNNTRKTFGPEPGVSEGKLVKGKLLIEIVDKGWNE
jgi:hypothetical protein